VDVDGGCCESRAIYKRGTRALQILFDFANRKLRKGRRKRYRMRVCIPMPAPSISAGGISKTQIRVTQEIHEFSTIGDELVDVLMGFEVWIRMVVSSVKVVADAGMWLENEGEGRRRVGEERRGGKKGKKEKPRNQRKGDSDGFNSRQEPERLHVLVCPAPSCWRSEVGSSEAGRIALVVRASPWGWARARSSWPSMEELVQTAQRKGGDFAQYYQPMLPGLRKVVFPNGRR
jgi:hypothetical protein